MKIANLKDFENYVRMLTTGEMTLDQDIEAGPFDAIIENLRILKQVLSSSGDNDFMISELNETLNNLIEQNKEKEAEIIDLNTQIDLLNAQVEENYNEVQNKIQLLDANLSDLGRGYIAFGSDFKCLSLQNKTACDLFEILSFQGKDIAEVLKDNKPQSFYDWANLFFDETMSSTMTFAEIAALGPQKFPNDKDKIIELRYAPMIDQFGKLQAIIVIASDKTQEYKLIEEKEKANRFLASVGKILKNKESFFSVLEQIEMEKDRIAKIKDSSMSVNNFDVIIRSFHTLKGGASTFGLKDLEDFCHQLEQKFINLKKENQLSLSTKDIELYIESLTSLKQSVLIELEQNVGLNFHEKQNFKEVNISHLQDFYQLISNDSTLSQKFYDYFLSTNAASLFGQYIDLVNKLSEQLGKPIHPIKIKGAEILIDAKKYSGVFQSMVHIFRNSMDHGMETPEEREMVGKDKLGKIEIEVSYKPLQNGRVLVIQIRDDGQGINLKRVKKKAIEKGLIKESDVLSEKEIANLVFRPGLSTKDEVSMLSGRGVGLDALMSEVVALGGNVRVQTIDGIGTSFIIAIPERSLQSIKKVS